MSDLATLEQRLQRIENVEAIKRTKYRYWRYLDTKRWADMRDVFAADAVVNYGAPGLEFRGVDAILAFLTQSLGGSTRTVHHGHHDDVEITGATTAKGTWALYNLLYNVDANRVIRIASFYHDEFVKQGEAWRIQSIHFEPLYHEEWKRDDIPSAKLVVG